MTNEEKLLNLAKKGGNDASLLLFDDIQALEKRVEMMANDLNKRIDEVISMKSELLELIEAMKEKQDVTVKFV